ncbi:MAG TPA: hypothetical protein VFO38_05605 [Candidatus Saccharimonadales bacterium]|nr:hypothetical protein [Candidatus Saccharimonadales bacterium]
MARVNPLTHIPLGTATRCRSVPTLGPGLNTIVAGIDLDSLDPLGAVRAILVTGVNVDAKAARAALH